MPTDFRSLLRRPIHLILDWDGTITKKDTLNFVGEIGYHNRRQNQWMDEKYGRLLPWSHFADAWMQDFSTHQAQYEPKTSARKTVREERAWLASLAFIEDRSVKRVESSGLFRGVTVDQSVDVVASAAVVYGGLQLREGWDSLLVRVLKDRESSNPKSRNTVGILSVNWSKKFIQLALEHSTSQLGKSPGTSENTRSVQDAISSMDILANEIGGLDLPGGSDGSLSKSGEGGIRTSADKLAHMPPSCRNRLGSDDASDQAITASVSAEHTVIYVGDSATDFEALLAADVGICMRDDPMGSGQRELAETFSRVGIEVLPLSKGHTSTESGSKAIYWVKNLGEIADILP